MDVMYHLIVVLTCISLIDRDSRDPLERKGKT